MNKDTKEKIPKKDKTDRTTNIILTILCVAVFLLGFMLGRGPPSSNDDEYCITDSIPTKHNINSFCKDQGFEFGTLNTHSCDGGIYCHRNVGKYDEWMCFPGGQK